MTVRQGLPAWRSIMFVPANVEKFLVKAKERGADAILIDLEDSISPTEKDSARAFLPRAVGMVRGGKADVGVRINRPLDLAVRDIEAAVAEGVDFLALPKVENAAHVRLLAELATECEARSGLAPGQVRFLVNIESAEAFFQMEAISRADARVVALALGSEDFSSSAGFEPSADALFMPKQLALLAARAAGILPVGFIGSVADFSDLDAFRAIIRRSRALGFVCGYAIHPAQVPVLNEEFAPGSDEIEHARALLAMSRKRLAEGVGAFSFRGKMVDKPIFDRAERLLDRATRLGIEA